jgi:hypothetical protein
VLFDITPCIFRGNVYTRHFPPEGPLAART